MRYAPLCLLLLAMACAGTSVPPTETVTPPSPPPITNPPSPPPVTPPPAPAPSTDDGVGPLAMRSSDFIDTIGVNAHFERLQDGKTIWSKQQVGLRQKLLESGIGHIRTAQAGNLATGSAYLRYLQSLDGVKINLQTDWNQRLTNLPQIGTDLGRQLATIEPRNEPDINNWSDTESPQQLRDLQKTLFELRAANASLSNVKMLGPSILFEKSARLVGDISAHVDYLNPHMYTGTSAPEGIYSDAGSDGNGYGSVKSAKAMHSIMGGDQCLMVTEAGEHNDHQQVSGHLGTTEKIAGRYIPRVYLELARRGVCRTFIYELVDEWNDPTNVEANFGLLRNDLTEKPAFTAVKNMITLLADTSNTHSSFAAGQLNYTLSGSTKNVSQMLFQKADGTFYLALWLGKRAWDWKTRSEVAVADQLVTVNVATRKTSAIHRLDDAGIITRGATQAIIGGQLEVSLSDRVTFVALK